MGIITNDAWADAIAPGFDLYVTDPDTTFVDFGPSPIPADFFCPGSNPFVGIVPLQGVPLTPFIPGLGDTDTIVERLDGIDPFDVPTGVDTIDIELVALSLVMLGGI